MQIQIPFYKEAWTVLNSKTIFMKGLNQYFQWPFTIPIFWKGLNNTNITQYRYLIQYYWSCLVCSYIALHLRISQAASNTFVLWCLFLLVKETGNAPKLASTFQDCCKKDWCAVAVRTWGHVPVAITPDVLQTVISETRNGLLPLAIL